MFIRLLKSDSGRTVIISNSDNYVSCNFCDSVNTSTNTIYRISSFFLNRGMRLKSMITMSFLFENWCQSIEFGSFGYLLLSSRITQVSLLSLWSSFVNESLSLKIMPFVVKRDRASKKVRKYSKGKVRYKPRLVIIRERQITGYCFKL